MNIPPGGYEGRMEKIAMPRIYYCPIDDTECPYYKDGFCTIGNPERECDDYVYYHNEGDNE